MRLSDTGIICSNFNFAESIIEIRATVWDGDMIIDHPYAIFMSRSAATEYNVLYEALKFVMLNKNVQSLTSSWPTIASSNYQYTSARQRRTPYRTMAIRSPAKCHCWQAVASTGALNAVNRMASSYHRC